MTFLLLKSIHGVQHRINSQHISHYYQDNHFTTIILTNAAELYIDTKVEEIDRMLIESYITVKKNV